MVHGIASLTGPAYHVVFNGQGGLPPPLAGKATICLSYLPKNIIIHTQLCKTAREIDAVDDDFPVNYLVVHPTC